MNLMLIRIARHYSGLTQKELAGLIGQSQNAISLYENGFSITPETERKLKAAFAENGIGQDELKFFQEIMSKK